MDTGEIMKLNLKIAAEDLNVNINLFFSATSYHVLVDLVGSENVC